MNTSPVCASVRTCSPTIGLLLAKTAAAPDVVELQAELDRFTAYYNERPHRELGRRTRSEAFSARPKAAPSRKPASLETHYRARKDKVDITGVVALRHNSRLHHIGIGCRHVGTRVLLLVADLAVRVVTEEGELLGELTLDPSRDYQRHGPKLTWNDVPGHV